MVGGSWDHGYDDASWSQAEADWWGEQAWWGDHPDEDWPGPDDEDHEDLSKDDGGAGKALDVGPADVQKSERYEAALVNFMDARQELLNARKAKGFKPPASSSSSKGGKGKGKGKRRKGKGKGKFRKGGKYKGKGKSKGKANLREDQKAAIAERHPPFKVLCA